MDDETHHVPYDKCELEADELRQDVRWPHGCCFTLRWVRRDGVRAAYPVL